MAGWPQARNWFDRGGADYARFRPQYPPQLLSYLAGLPIKRQIAVDLGCGSGQLTVGLARHFDTVLGFDPSASQLVHAQAQDDVHYACAQAEQLPLAAGCANLLVAAQAAHWFDLPRFYGEVRRVAASGAGLALVSYGVPQLPVELSACFRHFYMDQIRSYWPMQRQLIDDGYRALPFPFAERQAPALQIRHWWRASDFVGYVSTWSAVRRLSETGQVAMFSRFAQEITRLWGDAEKLRPVVWPINMRAGIVS